MHTMLADQRALNPDESQDDVNRWIDTVTSAALVGALKNGRKAEVDPSKLGNKDGYNPKVTDEREAMVALFDGGYIDEMVERGMFDTWKKTMGIDMNMTRDDMARVVMKEVERVMAQDYKTDASNRKVKPDVKKVPSYIDGPTGVTCVTVEHADGTSENFAMKILTTADRADSRLGIDSRIKSSPKQKIPEVGEEVWYKIEANRDGSTRLTFWGTADKFNHGWFEE